MPTYDQILSALHVRCPVHRIPDCSPLLNGCTWWQTVQEQARRVQELLDSAGGE